MASVRILLWHGYLLRGSGSNIYTANLAKAWRATGHDVLLMCQERDVDGLDFVDAQGDLSPGATSLTLSYSGVPPAEGSCCVVRPDIGGLLPVYVYDDYAGFTVKTFVDLTEAELETYTEMNVAAMKLVIEEHGPDAIVTGHEVMGPYIARQACSGSTHGYVAKLHGSALEYAVKMQDRYRAKAIEGLGGAAWVVGGSQYMIEEAARSIPGWRDRSVVVNPGCDIDLFRPGTEPRASIPIVGFVGKLIAAKGVHHLLAAVGLIEREVQVAIVGYGGFEEELRELAGALARGDVGAALSVAERSSTEPLDTLRDFLISVRDDEAYWSRAARSRVMFLGRLDHDALAPVLRTFDLLTVPSIIPEAFGMVAAEAAACAVLPVVPAHSGIGEVGRILESELDAPGLLTFDPGDPIRGMAGRIDRVLGADESTRQAWGSRASSLARARWSWARVAEQLLGLAGG